jgi:DNA-binding IclR family transcriptional regulator
MPTKTSASQQESAEKPAVSLVPAVERAAAILRYLQETSDASQCTVTKIAKAIDVHKSSCSYILRTLEFATLVEYDPATKAYSLGAALIGLGAAATRRRDLIMIGLRPIEALVRDTGLTCLTFTQLPNKSFIIIARADSAREIKVTIDIGQYFAPGTPALARIAMASMNPSEREDYMAIHCQQKFTTTTNMDRSAVLEEIEFIRNHGYAVSIGEYYAGNTVIVAPVFTPQDAVCRGICLIGFSSQIKSADLPTLGEAVRATAQTITQGLGGAPSLPYAENRR